MGLYKTIQNYTGLCRAIQDNIGLYRKNIQDYSVLYRAIQDDTGLYRAIKKKDLLKCDGQTD